MTDSPLLRLDAVSCGYEQRLVVENLSMDLEASQVCALLGPNGVGKTTLFKSILGSLPLLAGTVLVRGRATTEMSRAEMARSIGYVPQAHTPPFPYSVVEVVEMGRTAHLGITSVPSTEDRRIALEALNRMGIAELHDRRYTEISGGERQLVLIARALCQQSALIIMDEPCASLDFGNRARVLREIRRLANEGMSVLMTTHDPDHALSTADTVVVLVDEHRHVAGKPSEVITASLLEDVYGVPVSMGTVAGIPVAVASA